MVRKRKFFKGPKDVLVDLIRNVRLDWSEEFIEECATAFAKPSTQILIAFSMLGIIAIIYGFLIWIIFAPEVSLIVPLLLNLFWVGTILFGAIIFKVYVPKYKDLFRQFFGLNFKH